MKDEIKEIIDRLERIDHKECSTAFDFADNATFDEMARCFKERKKMANYITNLQEENEMYKKELEKADSITQSCIFEGSRGAGKSYRQCLNWLEDYKSKIDKAIEYLTSYDSIETIQQCEHSDNNKNLDKKTFNEITRRYLIVHDKLLNILQGSDDNER